MFFTREDILKIQQALLQLGVKDSELPSAEPVTYNDTLSIVQDGKNKQIGVKDFFNQTSLWKREDFLNITDRYDEHYIRLLEAINLVPVSQRKDGLVITFQDKNSDWRIYQFRGNITEFINEEKWFDLYDYKNYIIKSFIPDEEDITASTPDENGNSFLSLKNRIYDPAIFSGKGYKFVRKNIINVELATIKISVINPTTLEGDIYFNINNKGTKVHLSPTIHNTTKLVSEAIKDALVIAYNDYEVTVANSVVTLTRKYSGSISPTTFEMYNTGVRVIVEDSTTISKRNIITQEDINKTDTIYEIRYDFDLDGKTITIPKNCILYFTSGKCYNGSINMNNTVISTLYEDVLSEVNISGNYYNIQKNIKDANTLIQEHTNRLNDAEKNIEHLDTRSTQMEETIKGIAATGGASQATAVTYNNEKSKLTTINIQSAVDEVVENTAIKDEEGVVVETPFRYIQNEEFIFAKVDAEDKLLFGFQWDGTPVFGKTSAVEDRLQSQVNLLADKITTILGDDDTTSAIDTLKELKNFFASIDNTQTLTSILANLNNISTKLGEDIKNFQDTKVDKEEGKSLIEDEVKECFKVIENEEFIHAVIDSEGRLLFGIYRDSGKPYFPQNDMYHISQSEEFLWVILDAANHPLLGIQQDGTCWAAKAQWLDDIKAIKEVLSSIDETLKTFQPKEDGKGLINVEVADSFFYISNDEYIIAVVDAENRILAGIKYDGNPYFPNHEMYSVITNEEWLYAIIDAEDKLLGGFRADDGHMIVGGIDISTFVANALIDIADIKERTAHLSTIENKEYLSVETDAEGKVIGYIAPDGSHYLYKVKSETIPTEFSHIEDTEKRIHIITDADEKVLTAIDELGTEHNFLKQKYHNDVEFFKDVYINGVKYKPSRFYGNTIFVAASDSSDIDKKFADYVCDGINDEYEINKAIEDIGKCGTVFLFSGNFHIDSFGEHKGFEKSAIVVKDIGTYRSVLIKGIRHYYNGTNIVVSQKAFDAISQDEQPCVFNCLSPINNGEEPWYGAFWYVSLQDMFISIPTWKRKCIVVNLRNVGCGEEKNLRISAFGNNQYGEYCPTDYANEDTPEGLVGITGMHGWTYGDTTRYDNISVWGMHEAFQLGGEHLICNSLRARYNYCAYTFGNYKNSLSYGAFDHPLTLINCCDEKSTQGPIFAWNGLAARKDWNIIPDRKMQGITFIDFNTESYKYGAYEVEPGSFCGRIDYHYSNGVYGAFSNRSFWANGSGKKFITHDETHQDGGNTALRNSYRPNYMQRYFDTDLNKELICVNPSSKKWVDTNGIVVSQSNLVKQTGKLKDNTELLNKQITFKSVYDDSEYTITSENGKWDTTLYPDSYEIKVEGYEILPNILEVTEAKSDIELLAKKTYLVSGTISIERFNNFKLAFIDSDGKKYQTTILNKNFAINLKNGDYSIELQCTELNIKKCTINNNNVNLGQII